MHIGKAFFAGVVGGAAMTLIMAIARASGAGADLVLMLGTLSGGAPTSATWLLGFLITIVGSGLIGIAYGAAFESITRTAGVKAGLLLSLVHLVLAGIFVGLLGVMHPLVPETLPAPGLFMAAYGAPGVLGFIVAHLAFGAIVGGLYGNVPAQKTMID
jgi:hypothetical protein